MRAGLAVSAVGHVGFVLMLTMAAFQSQSVLVASQGAIVPIEIVDVAPESNVRALAEDVPEDQQAPQADQTVAEEPAPAPSPTAAPTPQRPQPRQQDSFDLNAIAAMVDRSRTEGRERVEGQRADRTQRGTGPGTADVVSLNGRVGALMERAMARCWRKPIDLPDPERLNVVVEFDLDRNGHLRGQPRVTSPRNYTFDPAMRTAVESALRAIRACDPYPFPEDPVVGQHFEVWSRLEQEFHVVER